MSKTVVALALLEQVNAFSAPVVRARQVQMFSEGDIGVLPPLGVYDPLGLIETRDMARYEIMEIKHGRAAMLGFLHVILVEAGAKIPTEECLAAPTGMVASLESMPTFGWLQIMLFCCMQETGAGNESSFFALAKAQTVDSEAGDIARHRLGALRRPGDQDLQAQRGAPERPRGDARHHRLHPARAPRRRRALPDRRPCRRRAADRPLSVHLGLLRYS